MAGLLTFVDLDRTFYVPSAVAEKGKLWAWWWFFVGANGALAAGLYGLVRDAASFEALDPWWRALLTGAAYPALVRSKLTTLRLEGQSVPFGVEALFEAVREAVYKRINRIAKDARYQETTTLAASKSLADLSSQVRLSIEQDALMTPDAKREAKAWMLEILEDETASESDKRASLADFILSGQHSERSRR